MSDTPDTKHAMTRLITETWASFHIRQKRELEAIERERDEWKRKFYDVREALCDALPESNHPTMELVGMLTKERDELRERVGELEGVLKPLAKLWDRFVSDDATFERAYYTFYKGEYLKWESAKTALAKTK